MAKAKRKNNGKSTPKKKAAKKKAAAKKKTAPRKKNTRKSKVKEITIPIHDDQEQLQAWQRGESIGGGHPHGTIIHTPDESE